MNEHKEFRAGMKFPDFPRSNEEIRAREIVAGYRVNLGQLSTGFSIKGSFTSEDDRFDPKRHSVQPTVQALDPLKGALTAMRGQTHLYNREGLPAVEFATDDSPDPMPSNT